MYTFCKLLLRITLFVLMMASIFHSSLQAQKGISSSTPITHQIKVPKYTSKTINRFLSTHKDLHDAERFELGVINWSMRTIHTLGVGTHHILSPTGGWTQKDLTQLAHQNIAGKLERLAQTALHLPAEYVCPVAQLSSIYQAHQIRNFSDGSVHISAQIPFNAYQQCFTDYIDALKKPSVLDVNSSEKLTQLVYQTKVKPRYILWMYIDSSNANVLNSAKTIVPLLQFNEVLVSQPLFNVVRWLKINADTKEMHATLHSMFDSIKPYALLWAKVQGVHKKHPVISSTAQISQSALKKVLRATKSDLISQSLTVIDAQQVQMIMKHAHEIELWILSPS